MRFLKTEAPTNNRVWSAEDASMAPGAPACCVQDERTGLGLGTIKTALWTPTIAKAGEEIYTQYLTVAINFHVHWDTNKFQNSHCACARMANATYG